GLRDSALDLILPLVAVHAEVSAGCSPFVDRAINTLAEGLMDALHQVAFQHADLEQLDANAFCQLSLELDYFQAVLQPFASPSLDDIIFQLRDMLLHRTMQSIAAAGPPPDDRPSYERQLSRGGGMRSGEWGEERDIPTPQTPEQLKGIADSLSADLLPGELRRTRVNVFCFGLRLPDDSLHASPSGAYDNASTIHGAQSTISSSSGSSANRAYSAILPVPDTSAGLAARARAAGAASSAAAATAVGDGYRPGAAAAAAAAAGGVGPGVGGTPRTAGLRGSYEGAGYGGGAGGGRGAYGAAGGGAGGVGAGMYGGAAGGTAGGAYGGPGGAGAAPYGGAAVPGSAARALDRRGQPGARGYGGDNEIGGKSDVASSETFASRDPFAALGVRLRGSPPVTQRQD
ncbi:unnamed protein product, partial [Closterium sp. NIES-54]